MFFSFSEGLLTAQVREGYTLSNEEGRGTWKTMHLEIAVRLLSQLSLNL